METFVYFYIINILNKSYWRKFWRSCLYQAFPVFKKEGKGDLVTNSSSVSKHLLLAP